MKVVCVTVEWIFGDISYFKFLDFKKDLKIGLSSVHNAPTILYGNTTSQYFDINPPTLGDYFI